MSREDNTDPCRIAARLKEDGTIIVTIALNFGNNGVSPIIGLGSPCYNITNDFYITTNLVNALCRGYVF